MSSSGDRVQLGSSGMDIIDELCEASIFSSAADYLTKTKLKLNNEQKLKFYAYYKQATVGSCNVPKPGLLDMRNRAKWYAWHDLGNMSKSHALVAYVNLLNEIHPPWRKEAEQQGDEHAAKKKKEKKEKKEKHADDGKQDDDEDEEGDDEDEDSEDDGASGGDNSLACVQSRPVHVEHDVESHEMTVCYYASIGDLEKVKHHIETQHDTRFIDDEKRTPLHWAVDRHQVSVVQYLLANSETRDAMLNARDADDYTPLFYACINELHVVILLLLNAGADAMAQADDDTPKNMIENMGDDALLKALHENQQRQKKAL